MRMCALLPVLALSTAGVATAQIAPPSIGPRSPAAIITRSDLESAIEHESGPIADAVLRVLPVGPSHVAVAVVRRSKVEGRTPPDAIVHEMITEVYHIIEGRGVLVTGGSLEGGKPLAPDSPVVRTVAGPSVAGQAISGGERRMVGPGDVVVIPPNTPHGFSQLATDHITYLIVRIDPERRLEIK